MNEQTNREAAESKGSSNVDPVKMRLFMQEIKDKQNLLLGSVGGLGAAAIGATIWALVTAATSFQIGLMAVGVGFLVGIAVRFFGQGIDMIFGIVGAVLSLVGCLAGNLLTVCIVVSQQEGIELFELLSRLDIDIIVALMRVTFSPIDLLFYGIAVYGGYKFSFRPITEEELAKLAL